MYYLPEVGSTNDLNRLLSPEFADLLPYMFMWEFDPGWPTWVLNISEMVTKQLHPLNVRSFAATSEYAPSVKSQEELFREGFDVVYTYDTKNGVTARTTIDKERGVTPP